MTYTKKQFLEDVAKEARALRKHATKKELELLNFETFDGGDVKKCIYGQMTGDCDSDRASELIQLCAPIYFEGSSGGYKTNSVFEIFRYSPIERYVAQYVSEKNKNLIAFLKGERKDLVL